jgi:hypothetical protein
LLEVFRYFPACFGSASVFNKHYFKQIPGKLLCSERKKDA